MIHKLTKNVIEYIEKNPEKTKSIIEDINKAWKHRNLIISNKDAIVEGIKIAEKSVTSMTSLFSSKLRGK